jgi:protein TonB
MRVGSSLQASRLIRRVEPEYTERARRATLRGTVLLEVTIDERGTVRDVTYMRGHPLVEQAVVDAVRQWRYTPACIDGTAVPVIAFVQVPFDLRAP